MVISSNGDVHWDVLEFPADQEARERLVAEHFLAAAERLVLFESQPSLRPFAELVQNQQYDLDFTVSTALGSRLLEVAEFAPLGGSWSRMADVPTQISAPEKASLLEGLIRKKSQRQGGEGRLLLLFHTEQAFFIDPLTREAVRRRLLSDPPRFDRVFYVSVKVRGGLVWELYPALPDQTIPDDTANNPGGVDVYFFHPLESHTRHTVRRIVARAPHYGEFYCRLSHSITDVAMRTSKVPLGSSGTE